MKFDEAMKAMQAGDKVTRVSWAGDVYFMMDKESGKIHTYQPRAIDYHYDEDIMLSLGWVIDGIKGTWAFYDIVDELKKGRPAKLETWNADSFIQYDDRTKGLVYHSMEILPFMPQFEAFMATDWQILP